MITIASQQKTHIQHRKTLICFHSLSFAGAFSLSRLLLVFGISSAGGKKRKSIICVVKGNVGVVVVE